MYVEEIKWLDKEGKEAILKVTNDTQSLMCFSCPCSYSAGDVLTEPLECLDTDAIVLCEIKENCIEKMEGELKYKLKGELKDRQNGIIDVYGFDIHIEEEKIPEDIINGMCVQFVASRIDVW